MNVFGTLKNWIDPTIELSNQISSLYQATWINFENDYDNFTRRLTGCMRDVGTINQQRGYVRMLSADWPELLHSKENRIELIDRAGAVHEVFKKNFSYVIDNFKKIEQWKKDGGRLPEYECYDPKEPSDLEGRFFKCAKQVSEKIAIIRKKVEARINIFDNIDNFENSGMTLRGYGHYSWGNRFEVKLSLPKQNSSPIVSGKFELQKDETDKVIIIKKLELKGEYQVCDELNPRESVEKVIYRLCLEQLIFAGDPEYRVETASCSKPDHLHLHGDVDIAAVLGFDIKQDRAKRLRSPCDMVITYREAVLKHNEDVRKHNAAVLKHNEDVRKHNEGVEKLVIAAEASERSQKKNIPPESSGSSRSLNENLFEKITAVEAAMKKHKEAVKKHNKALEQQIAIAKKHNEAVEKLTITAEGSGRRQKNHVPPELSGSSRIPNENSSVKISPVEKYNEEVREYNDGVEKHNEEAMKHEATESDLRILKSYRPLTASELLHSISESAFLEYVDNEKIESLTLALPIVCGKEGFINLILLKSSLI